MQKIDYLKLVTAVLAGSLAGCGIYQGLLNINWSQIFGG